MKIRLSVVLLFVLISATLKSQQKISYSDGTSISLDILSVDPDDANRFSVYAGGFVYDSYAVYNIAASYYVPKKIYASGAWGFTGFYADVSYMFFTGRKQSKFVNSLIRDEFSRKMYKHKFPIEKDYSLGLHVGVARNDYYFTFGYKPIVNSYPIGISMIKSGHVNIKVNSRELSGSTVNRLNLDAVYHSNFHYDIDIDRELDLEEYRKVTYRLYYEGRSSLWGGKGYVTLNYLAGISTTFYRSVSTSPMFGLGFGFSI